MPPMIPNPDFGNLADELMWHLEQWSLGPHKERKKLGVPAQYDYDMFRAALGYLC